MSTEINGQRTGTHALGPEEDLWHSRVFPSSLTDARKIVPVLLEATGAPHSVVDIGGGIGSWCVAFKENGADRVVCIDDARISVGELLVGPNEFLGCDLSRGFPAPLRCDLAVCLEVAEHLPQTKAQSLVDFLCACADRVLFSAAIPGQDGFMHINLRPPVYWKGAFAKRGFQRFDLIRPGIIADNSLAFWYRQNVFLFANDAGRMLLNKKGAPYEAIPEDFEIVHSSVLAWYRKTPDPPSLRSLLKELVPAFRRSSAYRIKRILRSEEAG